MKWISRSIRATLAAIAVCAGLAHAADKDEAPYVSKMAYLSIEVDKDGRAAQDVTSRIQVLQQGAIEALKSFSFSFSSSLQAGEVVEAYTLKQDGRKVVVPAGNYQRQTNEGRDRAGPFFSDRTTISVVFPDLAVGDAIHIQYRTTEKEPMFPGQFSTGMRYSPFAVQEDVRVTVRAPKDMVLREEHHFMDYDESEQDGKRVMAWRYANPSARQRSDDDDGLWSVKELPGLLVSTFPSYEAIAQAYGARALPKAEATAAIRELAATIVGTATQPREKARKLYEWVSRNITYGGNCIGVGAVVPRDLPVVLENRMGDCKDHATLLQALLAAAGIPSEQVLVNAGSDFELPEVPVVAMVNHVFNYLPTLDLYLDATAKEIPFGYLPEGSYAKPVIHVGAARALRQVPAPDHASNRQKLDMALKISDSGAAAGSMQVRLAGPQAARMRAYMRELNGQQERDFVKATLASYGYRARGTLERGDVQGLGDTFEFKVSFEIDNYVRASGATGALYVGPVVSTPMPVDNFASIDDRPASKRRQVCFGFHSVESYVVDLPPSFDLLSIPDNADIRGSLVDYKATYKRTGRQVRINRSLDDKSPGGICEPGLYAEFLKQAAPVGENLRSQLLFKRKR